MDREMVGLNILIHIISKVFDISKKELEKLIVDNQCVTQNELWTIIECMYYIQHRETGKRGAFRKTRGDRFGFRFLSYCEPDAHFSFSSVESYEINSRKEYVMLSINGIRNFKNLEELSDYIHSAYAIFKLDEIIF